MCTTGEECIEFETKPDKHWVKTKFSVYGGLDCSIFDFYFSAIDAPESVKVFSPMIGGQFNFSVPRWRKSLSLQIDGYLVKNHAETSYNYQPYSYDVLKLVGNIGVKYTYPKGKFRPSIEVGRLIDHYYKGSYFECIHVEQYSEMMWRCKKILWDIDPFYFFDRYYGALGFDYHLGNDHFILFRINCEDRIFAKKWQMKLGYTF